MRPTHHGELLDVPERMIVAPSVGVFRPHLMADGDVVDAGEEIGVLEGPGVSMPVCSPFRGKLIGASRGATARRATGRVAQGGMRNAA